MIYLQLFFEFFRIGLFSFGGGYAMIPLISDIIIKNQWMVQSEFTQIIGISQMTPGPIAVNSATFVGYKVAGVLGSVFATLGVSMPSLLLILLISNLFFKYSDHHITQSIFKGIRPVIAGLIIASALIVGKSVIFQEEAISLQTINIETLLITMTIFFIAISKKRHPIILILIGATLGLISLYF